ncbi:MAG: hypothetical protein SGJ11_09915 [Phycisphaerae bacterium]|nr:hypothetical protein [Phycisphaerae bacterium]
MPTPRFRRSYLAVAAFALFAVGSLGSTASAQLAKVLEKLNEPWSRILDKSSSWKPILTALLDITEPPKPIGQNFDVGQIWPGMSDEDGAWADWSAWAEKNASLGVALIANQEQVAFAMPYGDESLEPALKSKNYSILIDLDADGRKTTFGYLQAIAALDAWCIAEMYRLGEAGKFEDAFKIGVAHLKVLRQLSDQQMLEEKLYALDNLAEVSRVHRDYIFTYADKIPGDLLRRLGSKDYPLIRPQDGPRLKRLEMPEGDRYVAEAILAACFDDRGQPSPALFAEVFAGLQSVDMPLTRFGAARRWQAIAAVHGSLDASSIKLNNVYDDWWRRWRYRPFDLANSAPTELSTLNPIRYAAITLAVIDIDQAFRARRRAAMEMNGTATALALVSYKRAYGSYPDDIEKIFPVNGQKRFNADPYSKAADGFVYRFLGASPRTVSTVNGPVTIDGALLYARGENNEDDGGISHDPTAASNDVILWPPLRAVARQQE